MKLIARTNKKDKIIFMKVCNETNLLIVGYRVTVNKIIVEVFDPDTFRIVYEESFVINQN